MREAFIKSLAFYFNENGYKNFFVNNEGIFFFFEGRRYYLARGWYLDTS